MYKRQDMGEKPQPDEGQVKGEQVNTPARQHHSARKRWHHATPSNKGERRVEGVQRALVRQRKGEHMTSLGDGSNSAYLYQNTASQHSKAPYGYQKGAVVGKEEMRG